MENFVTALRAHYKKVIILLTGALFVYTVRRYFKKFNDKNVKKPKDFPTVESIEKFIDEFPLDKIKIDRTLSLKDLLAELSEFSDDEEWKDLIANVQTLYQQNPKASN